MCGDAPRVPSSTTPRERPAAARPSASPPRTGHGGPGSKAGRGSARRATSPPRDGTPRLAARPRRTRSATCPPAASGRTRSRTDERVRGDQHLHRRCATRIPGRQGRERRESARGNWLSIDDEARGALGGGLDPEWCRLGTLFEAGEVAGSGGRGHGRLQSGIGKMQSGRGSAISCSDSMDYGNGDRQPRGRISRRQAGPGADDNRGGHTSCP